MNDECYHDHIRYIDEEAYVKHFKEQHPEDYPFYCEECKKGFFSYDAIQNHNNAKH